MVPELPELRVFWGLVNRQNPLSEDLNRKGMHGITRETVPLWNFLHHPPAPLSVSYRFIMRLGCYLGFRHCNTVFIRGFGFRLRRPQLE